MCVTFIVKYILFFVNLVFALAGATLVGVGVAVLVQISDILDQIPVNLNAIPITIIVFGSIIFAIGFCGCYGAINQSRWLLTMYAVVMAGLAAGKLYFAIILFRGLSNIRETAEGWVVDAFRNLDLFPAIEFAFSCCGTTGPSSYDGIYPVLPPTCCPNPSSITECQGNDAFSEGCVSRLGSYFEVFGDAIAGVLVLVITAEVVGMAFSVFLCCAASKKR
ncbi:tetraspanin-9-like [Plodia interpunctella]|uniref:tetraspanin-9-like n=1 Tax=Plodia interpunctella TaxID=58824 RepID=UPI002367B49D|nr:tetraspanin-9-like [Plodia interpunctella]